VVIALGVLYTSLLSVGLTGDRGGRDGDVGGSGAEDDRGKR
jgi:hypothetical protein